MRTHTLGTRTFYNTILFCRYFILFRSCTNSLFTTYFLLSVLAGSDRRRFDGVCAFAAHRRRWGSDWRLPRCCRGSCASAHTESRHVVKLDSHGSKQDASLKSCIINPDNLSVMKAYSIQKQYFNKLQTSKGMLRDRHAKCP